MDQKENVIDRDIQLSVLLPGEVIKTTNVNGRYVEQKFEAVLWMKTGFSEGCVCVSIYTLIIYLNDLHSCPSHTYILRLSVLMPR